MTSSREVAVRADGTVAATTADASAFLAAHAGQYRIRTGPYGVLLLERRDGPTERRTRVLAMGEIVGKTTVLEIVSMVTNNGWRGELCVRCDRATRRLRIDQGALKGADSDVQSERLGEVMVSLGAIGADQLARCLTQAGEERRVGAVAVEEGLVDQKELFQMLRHQAERIFQGALLAATGSYEFTVPEEDSEAPEATLHLPVQALLFETVQRIDEMAYFRERIPSGELRPVRSEGAPRADIGDSLRPVMSLVDGKRSIVDIGRELRLPEFHVTKRIMQLLQIGCLELKEQQQLDRTQVDRIVKQLNDVLREIRDTVERHGGVRGKKQMLWTLQAWVQEASFSQFLGDSMKLDGDISVETASQKLASAKLDHPLETLHRAAHELASFAMFCASPSLPREAERALAKWVNQRLSRLRL